MDCEHNRLEPTYLVARSETMVLIEEILPSACTCTYVLYMRVCSKICAWGYTVHKSNFFTPIKIKINVFTKFGRTHTRTYTPHNITN